MKVPRVRTYVPGLDEILYGRHTGEERGADLRRPRHGEVDTGQAVPLQRAHQGASPASSWPWRSTPLPKEEVEEMRRAVEEAEKEVRKAAAAEEEEV